LCDAFTAKGRLYQDDAVSEIEKRFGAEFVYANEAGNPAISRRVLAAFRRLTEADAVWDRGDRCWERRRPTDPPGRISY
jgi:hypothetical protein